MKRIIIAGVLVLIIASVGFAYFQQGNDDVPGDMVKPVRVMEVSMESTPIALYYTGTVSPEEIRKVGFKNPGKIAGLYVEENDYVNKGDLIATLDTKELALARSDARESLESAKDAMEFSRVVYERMDNLFKEGAISLQDYEKAKLDQDLQQTAYNRAEVNFKNIQNSIDDATLKADTEGYVMDVLFKEGEMAGAGYPVVIMRCGEPVINSGLSEDDASKVKPGMPVLIKTGTKEVPGEVSRIASVPDEGTRTYNTKIIPEENSFNIGAIVKFQIILGEEEGLWIPLQPIMTDGADYVYVVEDGRAIRKNVTIEMTRSSRVRVKGLDAGDFLVTEGYKNLKDNDEVCID